MVNKQPGSSGRAELRIGAVDDHPVILAGISEGLRWHLPSAVVGPVTRTVGEFLAARADVDLVMLDIELHDGTDPAENVRTLVNRGWPVLLFTQDPRMQMVARTFRAGAAGILSKGEDLATIAAALRTVAGGEPYLSAEWAAALSQDEAWDAPTLTPREIDALRLYAAGMKLTSVARRLGVTEDTVRTYLLRARNKYSLAGRPANTKTDLYIRAVEDGILPAPGSLPER
jgi:DNA-binding NarL/FixJ family response regulator